MIDFLINLDTQLFLFLNGIHSSAGDFLMYWHSDKYIWIPLYAILLYLLYRFYGKKTLILMLLVALLITLSDQVSVHLFKNVFQRLRPCHEPALEGLIYLPGKCGGKYGFISSHASNSFAIAVFIWLLLKNKLRPVGIGMIIWAALVSYSRVYNGVHYPGDIIVGAMVGSTEALLIFALWKWIQRKYLVKEGWFFEQ